MKRWIFFGINLAVLLSCGILFYKIQENGKMVQNLQYELGTRFNYVYNKMGEGSSTKGRYDEKIDTKINKIHDYITSGNNQMPANISMEKELMSALKEIKTLLDSSKESERIRDQEVQNVLHNTNKTLSVVEDILKSTRTFDDSNASIDKKLSDIIDVLNENMQYIKKIRRR